MTLHPELREEGSLQRYFAAKLGRERDYRGVELRLVDHAYESGVAKFTIKGSAKCVTQLSEPQVQRGD